MEVHKLKCNQIIKVLNSIAPQSLACEWDNVGLLIGDYEQEVKKIIVALELTDEVAEYAVLEQADMIVTHHPMLFSAVKKITSDTPNGRRILTLIKNNICYYAMHTNFDAAPNGMASLAAAKLGLNNIEILDDQVSYIDETGNECVGGIGRIGQMEHTMTLERFCEFVKQTFGNKILTVYASKEQMKRPIHTVSIVPGSGKDYITASIQKGADVLITGDMGHHSGWDAMEEGLCVIDAGHYRTEQIFISYMAEFLSEQLKETKVIAMPVCDPFQII